MFRERERERKGAVEQSSEVQICRREIVKKDEKYQRWVLKLR